MEYRRFGKTELQISVLSCGTMRALDSQDQMDETIATAFEHGINHIETAHDYGASESFLGQTLKQYNRDRYILTTKICPTPDLKEFRQTLDQCFDRLEVQYLDLLAIHGINTFEHLDWVKNGGIAIVQEYINAGKIKHVGFSTHGSLELIQATIATNYFSFINLHYGIFFQRNEPAIEAAHAQDMGVFIISPGDKGGMLYTPSDKLTENCKPLTPLATNYRFLLQDDRIHTLSVGPANTQEWEQPLASIQSHESEQQVFDRLSQIQVKTLGTDRCSQCYLCLPCPEEINIPEVLRLRNLTIAHDMEAFGKYRYGMFENAGHWFPGRKANHCTDCGDCLPRCPERLEIPRLLRDTQDRLAGKPRRRLWQA